VFSHLDESDRPAMVDVSDKTPTRRIAVAQSVVELPEAVMALFSGGDIATKKGPVFQTAIIAGTMAAKQTSGLIPLCHPLPIDRCKFTIAPAEGRMVVITCEVGVEAKTGVEMEALVGASVAALTIYDMCKAFSQDIVIRETRLLSKLGGKSDYSAEKA